jgi:hypothetical protein
LFGSSAAPALRIALAVACIAIVAEGVALYKTTSSTATFQTASQTASQSASQTASARVIVRFAPAASIGAVSAMLDDMNADIVKGPMPDGAYVIALPGGADIDAVVKELRAKNGLVADAIRGS